MPRRSRMSRRSSIAITKKPADRQRRGAHGLSRDRGILLHQSASLLKFLRAQKDIKVDETDAAIRITGK